MKLLAIDLYAPLGHINLNKKILEVLSIDNDVIFLSSKSYIKKINFNNSIFIDDKKFNTTSKYIFVIKQILLIKYIIRKYVKEKDFDRIIILGYENISLALAWRFIRIPTIAICHNNLTRGKLSSFFFKKISNNISHVFFEKFMTENISNKIKNKLYTIPHPINPNVYSIRNNNKLIDEKLIFSPSSSSDNEAIMSFALDISKQDNFYLFAKSNNVSKLNNVYFKEYFENYEELFQKAKYIFIPFKYDYRVSGIFYDAITLKKTIITNTKSLFMKKMAEIYPDCIFIFDNINQIEDLKVNKEKQNIQFNSFFNKHDDENLKFLLLSILNTIAKVNKIYKNV